jgi:hypothetical protein
MRINPKEKLAPYSYKEGNAYGFIACGCVFFTIIFAIGYWMYQEG